MSAISVENVWAEFGDQIVIENLNLEIASGSFLSVVGPSGCGKSTFLRMVLGQDRPSRGKLLLDGKPLPDEPGADRGVVFQRYSVLPHLTVLGNVLLAYELGQSRFLGRLFGSARKAALEKSEELIVAVGLGPHRDKHPSALSGGMQQRLAIAQALAKDPKVLLLDEPFGALDPGTRTQMHALLKPLWERLGMTVIMVTHDLKEAFNLGTRVVAFDKVRHDPQAPGRFGARITYDLDLTRGGPVPVLGFPKRASEAVA
ncbi:ABC transporter ATP-binding protein [Methylopila sp. M107]|uniref:ABC transporter ATP-binding protein n=1 Tax=Methylopila sp. M107 TaxID=1101190 RepID=UPI00037E874E|nr:ABC transporter ATP-binding protein [Methylopila sp. M107]